MKLIYLMLIALMALNSANSLAEIYRYVDKYGNVHYGDRRLNSEYKPIQFTWKGWVEIKYYKEFKKNKKLFSPYIDQAASKHRVDSKLIHAVIQTESYYNPIVKSRAGAVGLMQLMPATAKRFGVKNRQSPEQNINAGTKYLRILLDQFDNDLRLALAAYNAGEGTVKRYGNKIPPYPETQRYVEKVLKLYKG